MTDHGGGMGFLHGDDHVDIVREEFNGFLYLDHGAERGGGLQQQNFFVIGAG